MTGDWEAALCDLVLSSLPAEPPTAQAPTAEPAAVVVTELLPGMSETDAFIGGFRKLLDALGYESGWQAVPNPLTGGVKLRLVARRRED